MYFTIKQQKSVFLSIMSVLLPVGSNDSKLPGVMFMTFFSVFFLLFFFKLTNFVGLGTHSGSSLLAWHI